MHQRLLSGSRRSGGSNEYDDEDEEEGDCGDWHISDTVAQWQRVGKIFKTQLLAIRTPPPQLTKKKMWPEGTTDKDSQPSRSKVAYQSPVNI